MADTLDLGSSAARCAGSSPVSGTKFFEEKFLQISNFQSQAQPKASQQSLILKAPINHKVTVKIRHFDFDP